MFVLEGTKIVPTVFPDKTSQVWKIPEEALEKNHLQIRWEFESEAEVFQLVQLADLLASMNKRYSLYMYYLPYARQDKPINNEQTFALYSFARILNSCEFERVVFVDGHSDEATRLIDRAEDVFPECSIGVVRQKLNDPLLAYPDKGAFDRYSPKLGFLAVIGDKVRDEKTGWITHYRIEGVKPEGRNVLIVDDICDGGMTFKLLARDLLKAGAASVHLYVTHGIFSKGLETLRESGIERIFTLDGEVE